MYLDHVRWGLGNLKFYENESITLGNVTWLDYP